MADQVQWSIKGEYFEACSCDYGCPCNFNGFPTKGVCEANIGFTVREGRRADVDLAGVTVFETMMWPKAIHEGNGTAAVFIDEKATEEQRNAIVSILTAADGGLPFEILANTITEVKGPFFVPVSIEWNETKTKASVPGAEVELAPHTNPVTGEEHEVHTVLPGGFLWKDGVAGKAVKNVANVDGMKFDWTGQNAYFAKVDWSNAETGTGATTKFGK